MHIVERHPFPEIDLVQREVKVDPSARFILDLATSGPPMSLAALRAASDIVEKVSEAGWRDAPVVRRLGARCRLRIVTSRPTMAL